MNIKNQTSFFERTDLLKNYLKEINSVKALTAAEEKALFAKYAEAETNEEKLAIRNEIITRNQRFVFAVAKRYTTDGNLLPDLINEGNIGLMIAFDSFDPKKDNRFCSYAVWYIRREIKAYMDNMNVMVRTTNNVKIAPKVKAIINEYYAENGRNPIEDEIIDILKEKYDITVKDPSDIYLARIEYINASVNEDDDDNVMENTASFTDFASVNNDYEDVVEAEGRAAEVSEMMNCLDERERRIIELALGLDGGESRTNKEVAKIMGNITSERVRQIKAEALAKMKERYNVVAR